MANRERRGPSGGDPIESTASEAQWDDSAQAAPPPEEKPGVVNDPSLIMKIIVGILIGVPSMIVWFKFVMWLW